MCQQVCNESFGGHEQCCCSGTFSPEDEIKMLEAMKTLGKIRLDAIDRKIIDLQRTVKK